MKFAVEFTRAVISDVLAVGRIVLAQKRITGFRQYGCCPRFEGERHARYCGSRR